MRWRSLPERSTNVGLITRIKIGLGIGNQMELLKQRGLDSRRITIRFIVAMLSLLCLVPLYLVFMHGTGAKGGRLAELSQGFIGGEVIPTTILEGWAQYALQYPVDKYHSVPKGCKITQVNIIQRHGARFPTDGATDRILKALQKLTSAKSHTDPNLQFLENYTYDLGIADLVPLGALQSYLSGKNTFTRYKSLVSNNNIPFVRASDSARVIDSATNWTAGFSFSSQSHYNPVLSVIMSEEPTANNTLDDSGCPLAGDSDEQVDTWVGIYAPPIAERLNRQAIGLPTNLTAADVHNLIQLCPFESVAKGKLSPFCNVFTKEEFAAFEWAFNLDKYYGTGYGQPIGGRIQGVGYVNELIARLTHTPVRDNTQTNRTLTSNPATFSLNRTIYADFSHDNQMIAIYSAIGLFNETGEVLSTTQMNEKTEWDASDIVPFSAIMVVERLQCEAKKEYVRILVNDKVQPLSFCGGDANGLCTVKGFVESQTYARSDGEGDFEKCFN